MRRPITSTYRLQLRGPNADPSGRKFGFAEAAEQVPYLRDLGVSHLYLSPIFAAVRESNHNYDVINPTEINPELGGIEGLRSTARPSFPRARGGRAVHEGKGEGARPRSSWRSGKRRTGWRIGLASAGGPSPNGGPRRGPAP